MMRGICGDKAHTTEHFFPSTTQRRSKVTRKSKKYTYTSPAQRELIQWIDDREERSRFWSAAREIVLAGFPDNYGNPLLDDPNNPVTTNEFLEAY